MKNFIVIIISILLFSCEKQEKFSLVGEWCFDSVVLYEKNKNEYEAHEIEKSIGPNYEFIIKNDSVICFKNGFFNRISLKTKASCEEYPSFNSLLYYLGTQTNYKISDSLLIYYDKSNKENDTIILKKINNNEIIIKIKENAVLKFVKKDNSYLDSNKYDAVVINRSPCFGSCPFNFTYLDRNGDYYFKSKGSNIIYNDISTTLTQDKIEYYFNILDRIDINKLNNYYSYPATCAQTNTISFFKKGKIVKTIEAYISTPIDLQFVINEISFAYQNVPQSFDFESILGEGYDYGMQFKNSNLRLLDSESDFLEVSLSKAKKVDINFEEKYEMNSYSFNRKDDSIKILTDGRYYKFIKKDDSSFTIDLGYNFIEINPILKEDRYN